jgi:hypothetical protein
MCHHNELRIRRARLRGYSTDSVAICAVHWKPAVEEAGAAADAGGGGGYFIILILGARTRGEGYHTTKGGRGIIILGHWKEE